MKKRAEIAIAALAVMFICFSLGYFAGRRSIPSEVSISAGTVIVTPATEQPDDDAVAHAAASLPPTVVSDFTPATSTPSLTPEISSEPSEAQTTDITETEEETPEPTPVGESHYTADGLLRINLATQKELETLPGIGEVIASRIIEYRTQNGPFSKLSTLKVIKGIGDSRYDGIKDLVSVE